jgi:hypothetical protein
VQTAILANANMLDNVEETSAQLTEMSEIVTPTGFTDAVRRALQAAGKRGLTPVEVRDALVESGVDLSGYSNPLAVIHTTLKRLVTRTEARPVIADGEETVYQWLQGKTVSLSSLMRPRLRTLTPLDTPVDPEKLPEEIRGYIYGPRKGKK